MFDPACLQRFMDKVSISDDTGCWIWTAFASGRGNHKYGSFAVQGKPQKAHRLSYQHFKGEIPQKMSVCHKCDNTLCVNPAHLFVGSQRDNMVDCRDKGRLNRKFGESHGNNKLTAHQVLDILNSKAMGAGTSELARRYDVTPSVIVSIMSGRSWAWLTGKGKTHVA